MDLRIAVICHVQDASVGTDQKGGPSRAGSIGSGDGEGFDDLAVDIRQEGERKGMFLTKGAVAFRIVTAGADDGDAGFRRGKSSWGRESGHLTMAFEALVQAEKPPARLTQLVSPNWSRISRVLVTLDPPPAL